MHLANAHDDTYFCTVKLSSHIYLFVKWVSDRFSMVSQSDQPLKIKINP